MYPYISTKDAKYMFAQIHLSSEQSGLHLHYKKYRKHPLTFPQTTAASLAPSTVDTTSTIEQPGQFQKQTFQNNSKNVGLICNWSGYTT